LKATHIIFNEPIFELYRKKFENYQKNKIYKFIAFIYKAIFKLLYF